MFEKVFVPNLWAELIQTFDFFIIDLGLSSKIYIILYQMIIITYKKVHETEIKIQFCSE